MKGTERYAAKLLFQFRVVADGRSNKRRTCEERIILIRAKSAQEAFEVALKRGKESEHSFRNNYNNVVYFEFVGLRDLMHLGIESDEDEVWYEIREYLQPRERRAKLIPPKSQLSAMRGEVLPKFRTAP